MKEKASKFVLLFFIMSNLLVKSVFVAIALHPIFMPKNHVKNAIVFIPFVVDVVKTFFSKETNGMYAPKLKSMKSFYNERNIELPLIALDPKTFMLQSKSNCHFLYSNFRIYVR